MVVGTGTVGMAGGPVVSTTNQTIATTNNANELQTGAQNNTFTPGQQALQGQAANYISNILAGGAVPQNMGLPQSVYDAAFHNFNKYQAPMLAAQHGAGSPAINASMEELNLQLAGLAGQRATGNALDAFSQAANFALKPIGQTNNNNRVASGNETQKTNSVSTTTDVGGLLERIAFASGGGFPSVFGSTGSV